MVNYYIGNVREKRFYFRRKRERAALGDNGDVLADFRLSGKLCFVLGDIPYGDMRVGEYLGYATALKTRLPLSASGAKKLLLRAGIKLNLCRKMRSIGRVNYRAVALAAALEADTREVYLNFDGVPYSLSAKRKIRAVLKRLSRKYESVNAAVSDYRFIPRKATVFSVTGDGAITEGMTKSASRKCGKLRFGRNRTAKSALLAALEGGNALLCDN